MMKTRKLIIATVWIGVSMLIWSCNDSNTVEPENPSEQLFSSNILQNTGSAWNRIRGIGFGGPMGALYGNLAATSGRSVNSPASTMRMASGRVQSDSTDQDVPDCLIETWEDDGNGNYSYTLDFGDGCDYYGEFMKGKLVEVGNYTDESFASSATYTNFGGEDWSIDGTYSYSGTWVDNFTDLPEGEEDSVDWEYSASYEFEADLTEQYTDYGYEEDSVTTGENVITVDYVASGSETSDQDGYTIESRTESVEVSSGESFTSQVDTPLHMDYECEEVWIFVTGVESGNYTYGDETGSYSVNYGDGTCDNLILLTENGVTSEIDLGDEWDEWEEECGEDHDNG